MRHKGSKRVWRVMALVLLVLLMGSQALAYDPVGSSALLQNSSEKACYVEHYAIDLSGAASSTREPRSSYAAARPNVVTFLDQNKRINVAYLNDKVLCVKRYDVKTLQLVDAIQMEARYPLFGNIICDQSGKYYVAWGQTDSAKTNCITMAVTKYDYSGNYVGELTLTGYESAPYSGDGWGTCVPFNSANCSMAIQNGILAVNYGRKMYNGHQSNMILYVKCATMKRVYANTAYTSHSFDQRIYATADGKSYIALNHGDAYDRGFSLTKITKIYDTEGYWLPADGEVYTFHFREGATRSYGYNETFAQMGGLAELDSAFVFAASSERMLSLAEAPSAEYMGYNGARDLFVQILKKNFTDYSGADCYYTAGETRKAQGTKPASATTQLWLNGDEEDYGILWLTNYDASHYAANPKVFSMGNDKFGVMWEKREYVSNYWSNSNSAETYFALLDVNGKVLVDTMRVPDCLLAADADPVVVDGAVYWATKDNYGEKLHVLRWNKSIKVSPDGVALDWIFATVNAGESIQLNATVTPEDATDKTVTWSSSDTNIAIVNDEGRVTGVADGEAVITVRTNEGGKEAKCTVTVKTAQADKKAVEDGMMFRLYNPNSGEHFYTSALGERNHLIAVGWNYEGVAWKAATATAIPVYRLYNPNAGDHHYTTSAAERDMLVAVGWNDEGIGWYSDEAEGEPLYRLYNPNATQAGAHHYTTNAAERDMLVSIGWNDEGIGWYGRK